MCNVCGYVNVVFVWGYSFVHSFIYAFIHSPTTLPSSRAVLVYLHVVSRGPAHHHMSVLIHQDRTRNPKVGSGQCGGPYVHVSWAPGVHAAGLGEADAYQSNRR